METLSLDIFVVPIIVLTLVVLLYIYFGKQVMVKEYYKNFIIRISVLSFSLNFIWELVQGPLYKGFKYDWQHISFCALASVADMLMVLLLLFVFGLIYKDIFWVRSMNRGQMLSLILIGTTGAIIGEIWHTTRGDWAYAESMPIVPMIELGISPLLQFALLPLLIFSIDNKIVAKENLKV